MVLSFTENRYLNPRSHIDALRCRNTHTHTHIVFVTYVWLTHSIVKPDPIHSSHKRTSPGPKILKKEIYRFSTLSSKFPNIIHTPQGRPESEVRLLLAGHEATLESAICWCWWKRAFSATQIVELQTGGSGSCDGIQTFNIGRARNSPSNFTHPNAHPSVHGLWICIASRKNC